MVSWCTHLRLLKHSQVPQLTYIKLSQTLFKSLSLLKAKAIVVKEVNEYEMPWQING